MTTVLLVEPPMHHAAFFSPLYRRAAAELRRVCGRVQDFHCGSDFVAYLLRREVQDQLAARAQAQVEEGRFAAADSATALMAAAFTQTRSRPDLFAESGRMPSDLQSDAFFDPFTAAMALHRIDQAFTLASLAYSPVVIDRRGFSHPGLQDESQLLHWLSDEARNPFLTYARRYCRPPVAPAQSDHVILVVESPGRLAGALTLARVWREQAPQTGLSLLAADDRLRECTGRLCAQIVGGCPEPDWMPAMRRTLSAGGSVAGPPPDDGSLLRPSRTGAPAARARIHAGRLRTGALQSLPAGHDGEYGGTLVWHDPQGDLSELTALLYRAAKKGFWNHLVLPERPGEPLIDDLIRFAAANPNIVHSWCHRTAPASAYSDSRDIYPEGSPPYGATRPLPGIPLWQWLQDPVYLAAQAARHGVKQLARMFLMPGHRGVHVAGSRMAYHFVSPSQLPPGHLDEIVRLVAAGGSVKTQWVRHNLERAFLIGYVVENGLIIGDSSLKHPRQEYIEAVSRQTGIDLSNYLERGYTSVRPEYRNLGVGAKLLEGLTERAEGYKIYSIIAEDNLATQKMAIRTRTRRVAAFYSQRSGKTIGVWIPEWMLPQGVELPPQPDLE